MKATSAQTWLAHSLEGLAVMTAVSTVAILIPQIQTGDFTLKGVGAAVLSAAITVGSKYGAGVLTNTQTAQAITDTVSQAVQQATPTPVVINNHIPAAPAPQTPTPVQQEAPTQVQPVQYQQFQPPLSTNTYPLAAIQAPQVTQ